MKTLRRFFKLVSSVLIGTGITFAVYSKLLALWRFDISNSKHWKMIWQRWESGSSFSTAKEVTFLLLIVCSPFIWIVFCFISHKISWGRLICFPFVAIRNSIKAKQIESARRTAMADAAAALIKKPVPHSVKPLPDKILKLRGTVRRNLAETSVNEEYLESVDNSRADFDMWQNIEKGLERNNIFTLRTMDFAGCQFDLTAVTQEGVYLMCSGPTVDKVWETRDNATPPVWIATDTGETVPAPIAAAQKARDALQREIIDIHPEYADLTVNACVVLCRGKIDNMSALMSYLEETDMSVLRTGICKMRDLPDSMAIVELIKTQERADDDMINAVSRAILNLTENGDD